MKMAMSSKKDMDRIDGQIASHGHTSAGTGFASLCRDGHIVDVQSLTFPDLIKNNWIFEGSFDASEDCNAKNKVFR